MGTVLSRIGPIFSLLYMAMPEVIWDVRPYLLFLFIFWFLIFSNIYLGGGLLRVMAIFICIMPFLQQGHWLMLTLPNKFSFAFSFLCALVSRWSCFTRRALRAIGILFALLALDKNPRVHIFRYRLGRICKQNRLINSVASILISFFIASCL